LLAKIENKGPFICKWFVAPKLTLKTLIFQIRINQIIFYPLKKQQIPCHIVGQFDAQYVHMTIAAITMGN
jgi:hypothetical protein